MSKDHRISLFSPGLDVVFFIVPVLLIAGLIPFSYAAFMESFLLIMLFVGFTHVFMTFLPTFFDENIRKSIGAHRWILGTLFFSGLVVVFNFSTSAVVSAIYYATYLHGIAQFYGFLRIAHKKSSDSRAFKNFEIFYFFVFLLLGLMLDYSNGGIRDNSSNSIYALIENYEPFTIFSVPLFSDKSLFITYLICFAIYLLSRKVCRTDNRASLILIFSSHFLYFILGLLSKNYLLVLLTSKLVHDVPYTYFVVKQWKQSQDYIWIFRNKNLWALAGFIIPLTALFFAVRDLKWTNNQPNWLFIFWWFPSLYHYYMDSIIWKKRLNVRVV